MILYITVCFFLYLLYYKIYNTNKYIESFNIIDEKQRIYSIMLKKIVKAFNNIKIPFFLSSGTCLGYFREKKFIDHDYDIDIGIFEKDYSPVILDELKKMGFILYRFFGDLKTGCEFSFYYPNKIIGKKAKFDLFLHYFEEDSIYWNAFISKTKKKIKYKVPKFTLKEVKFMGLDILVPHPTKRYIKSHYGKDWFIPKKSGKNYKFHSSPVSIVNK